MDCRAQHYKRPEERPFTRAERERVTCLFGGLTSHHDGLLQAAFEGLGYRVARIPTPRKADCQTGKEYCNTGMCNPAYFTIGALINYLRRLRDEHGVPTAEILRDYLFVTAGSAGPCRFGMYESEYRLALKNSGFDGFRVIAFQQMGGVKQSGDEAGLELTLNFALRLLVPIMMGDLLIETACRIRPYEVVPGQTNRVLDQISMELQARLRDWTHDGKPAGIPARLLATMTPGATAEMMQRIVDQVFSNSYVSALEGCARKLNEEIEVDYTRPKPICKVTGEFWAQITEGDGNFNMFPFLESQGAEALVEPIMTWVNYLFESAHCRLIDQRGIHPGAPWLGRWDVPGHVKQSLMHYKNTLLLFVVKRVLNREYERMRVALGSMAHKQIDQRELRRIAHPYFDHRIAGGEGYLEVAKTIYYSVNHLAHMVLSLKPFGCLPSTQSDGAQAAVLATYPDINFIPVETSGDGDINAYSRVQMALGDAKARCKREFDACLSGTGHSLEAIRRFCDEHRDLRRPLQTIPHHEGVVGKAANFVLHVGMMMGN